MITIQTIAHNSLLFANIKIISFSSKLTKNKMALSLPIWYPLVPPLRNPACTTDDCHSVEVPLQQDVTTTACHLL